MRSIITLLTDFGLKDGFAGVMKGVILTIHAGAKIVDLCHDIAPQNITQAAFVLKTCYRYFPPGTVHVVVVDPGVGSARRILCVDTLDYVFLAPDNGVLAYVFQDYPEANVYAVAEQAYFLKPVSQTFHGRDIFAPVAAHLSAGLETMRLGIRIDDYERGYVARPAKQGKTIKGEIAHIDAFGNLISNIPVSEVRSETFDGAILLGTKIDRFLTSYAEAAGGEVVLLPGSAGFVEVAAKGASAAAKLHCHTHDEILISIKE